MESRTYEYEITAHIAKLSENKRGGSLELNKTRFPGQPEKYDLRRWYLDENGVKQPGKGVTFNDLEFEELKGILMDW